MHLSLEQCQQPDVESISVSVFFENFDNKMRVSDRHGGYFPNSHHVEVRSTPAPICAPRGVLGLTVRCGHGALLELRAQRAQSLTGSL